MEDKEQRLKQLMRDKFLSDQEIEERDLLIEDLGLVKEDSPISLAPEITKSLNIQLHNLRIERKALELQANIQKEKEKIKQLKQHMEKKKYWFEQCKEWVHD